MQRELPDDLELEEFTDDEFRAAMLKDVTYPAIFITGITTLEELEFFKNRQYNAELALPLYGELYGQIHKIGMLDLTLDSLLSLRSIFHYELELRTGIDNVVSLDLDDPETLIKFIKL